MRVSPQPAGAEASMLYDEAMNSLFPGEEQLLADFLPVNVSGDLSHLPAGQAAICIPYTTPVATHASASDAAQNKRPARQEQSPGEQHCERCRIFLPDVCRISGKPLWMYNNQHCITNARYMCGLPSVFDQGIKQYFTSWVPQQLPLGWRGGLIPSLSDAKGTPFERLKHQGENHALCRVIPASLVCAMELSTPHICRVEIPAFRIRQVRRMHKCPSDVTTLTRLSQHCGHRRHRGRHHHHRRLSLLLH